MRSSPVVSLSPRRRHNRGRRLQRLLVRLAAGLSLAMMVPAGLFLAGHVRESLSGMSLARADPSDIYYANCAAVRVAGVAPIYAGQPGYRAGLDADSDGIACEPFRAWRGYP